MVLHGDKSAGAVVVRDVPLDPTGNPGADQADQGRLDDVLTVKEIVVVGFVDRLEEAAADLR